MYIYRERDRYIISIIIITIIIMIMQDPCGSPRPSPRPVCCERPAVITCCSYSII